MSEIIDARGLSCPQPVLMTIKEIRRVQSGELVVLVDTEVSRENVSRASTSQGWEVKGVEERDDGWRLTIEKR